ncbi:Rap1a/Tai family immunity protein (plasmid) [Microvirga sp. RSM25]|uniref:Rap1a/Tai family immunity protein n=1 Tax=Microvirga sp. RSM25 TaxID=3273802 RepID=UPI00384E9118
MTTACRGYLDNDKRDHPINQGMCAGMIGAMFYYGSSLPRGDRFCSPSNANTVQAIRIVINYMDNNPAILHNVFYEIVEEALRKAWPCP